MLVWEGEAPSLDQSAVDALARLAPRGETLAWLTVGWRPDWQRWVVWQMTPAWAVPATVWGPDTRTLVRPERKLGHTYLRIAPDPRYRLWLNPALMTRWAWRLHRDTGCYAQPLWVVEGSRGGHKWQFSEEESRLAAIMGGDGEAPEPGSLPYAPFDNRVLDKLRVLDRVRGWNLLSRGLHELDARDVDARERELMQAGNRALWNWLDSQVERAADAVGISYAGDPGAGYRDADVDYEQIERDFIESEN